MSKKVDIVGAGLAGLLAGAIMRDHVSSIIEKQPSLPHNHTAVMRFRSRAVADATNIPFRKVPVAWTVHGTSGFSINDLARAMMYSWNCTGVYDPTRSIARFLPGLFIDHRYVSPPNLPALLAAKLMVPITYGFNFHMPGDNPVISTIPMPLLGKMLGYNFKSEFRHRPGVNCFAQIIRRSHLEPIDCYATVYLPSGYRFQRVTLTGDRIIGECYTSLDEEDLPIHLNQTVPELFGLQDIGFEGITVHRQEYAKIVAIDENERRQFIRWATREHNIYSLGRYATWRPGLLLDDLVQDIRLITELIWGGNEGEQLIHDFAKGNK